MKRSGRLYLELCKINVALLAAYAAALGFLLAATALSFAIIPTISGVFFLTCGCLALNQYQERDLDALMARTCGRPLPSGRIRPVQVLYLSGGLLFLGWSALSMTGSLLVCALGLLALIWYNGVYTPLKRKSAFAAVPGALLGAIPPAMGWIAGGGSLGDPRLLMLCFFFFLWQVPHTWLLLLHYDRDYAKAGLPSPARIFSPAQLQRIIFSWLFATTLSGLFLSALGMVHYLFINILLGALSSWLIWHGFKPLLHKAEGDGSLCLFKKTNYYLLALLLLLSADRLLYA